MTSSAAVITGDNKPQDTGVIHPTRDPMAGFDVNSHFARVPINSARAPSKKVLVISCDSTLFMTNQRGEFSYRLLGPLQTVTRVCHALSRVFVTKLANY